MDVTKIKGVLDAIEAESKQPQPSHANLARLVHMALTDLLGFLDMLCKGIVPLLVSKAAEEVLQQPEAPTPEPSAPAPVPLEVKKPELKIPEAEPA